jgi:hypothetical protein
MKPFIISLLIIFAVFAQLTILPFFAIAHIGIANLPLLIGVALAWELKDFRKFYPYIIAAGFLLDLASFHPFGAVTAAMLIVVTGAALIARIPMADTPRAFAFLGGVAGDTAIFFITVFFARSLVPAGSNEALAASLFYQKLPWDIFYNVLLAYPVLWLTKWLLSIQLSLRKML